jgi:hypothetical protein
LEPCDSAAKPEAFNRAQIQSGDKRRVLYGIDELPGAAFRERPSNRSPSIVRRVCIVDDPSSADALAADPSGRNKEADPAFGHTEPMSELGHT